MLRFKAADARAGVPPAATIATSFLNYSSVHFRFRWNQFHHMNFSKCAMARLASRNLLMFPARKSLQSSQTAAGKVTGRNVIDDINRYGIYELA
jgi:hypothetical protein